MSRPSSHESSSGLKKVAIAVVAGVVVAARARMGSALVFAGLTWLVSRSRQPNHHPKPVSLEASDPALVSLDNVCAPSDPFIEKEGSEDESWLDLRAALVPPASLFTPLPVTDSPSLGSSAQASVLQSEPVFVDVAETFSDVSVGHSILPDTITIPTTPDPPPGLLEESPDSAEHSA